MIKELISGGTAGALGIAIGNPLDVIKLRMQIAPEKYSSSIQTFKNIIKYEGINAFYKGLLPPLFAQFAMNSILFTTNSLVMDVLEPTRDATNPGHPLHIYMAGCIGGFTQCFVLVPADVVKCMLQADTGGGSSIINSSVIHSGGALSSSTTTSSSSGSVLSSGSPRAGFTGPLDCIAHIVRTEGARGLFKGFASIALREIPAFGVYFSVYNHSVSYLSQTSTQPSSSSSLSSSSGSSASFFPAEVSDLSTSTSTSTSSAVPPIRPSTTTVLLSGGFAGAMSWTVIYPMDVIKSNIQTSQGSQGILATTLSLKRKYGWGIFTRGLGVTVLRAFPVNAAVFYFYELFRAQLDQFV